MTLNHQLEALVIAVHVAKTVLLERGREIFATAIKEILLGYSEDHRYILAALTIPPPN